MRSFPHLRIHQESWLHCYVSVNSLQCFKNRFFGRQKWFLQLVEFLRELCTTPSPSKKPLPFLLVNMYLFMYFFFHFCCYRLVLCWTWNQFECHICSAYLWCCVQQQCLHTSSIVNIHGNVLAANGFYWTWHWSHCCHSWFEDRQFDRHFCWQHGYRNQHRVVEEKPQCSSHRDKLSWVWSRYSAPSCTGHYWQVFSVSEVDVPWEDSLFWWTGQVLCFLPALAILLDNGTCTV